MKNEQKKKRREHIAIAIFQGLAACERFHADKPDGMAKYAVKLTDALIAELDKPCDKITEKEFIGYKGHDGNIVIREINAEQEEIFRAIPAGKKFKLVFDE